MKQNDELSTLKEHEERKDNRESVMLYSFIPQFALRLIPKEKLEGMYHKSLDAFSETPQFSLNYEDVLNSAIRLEKEAIRRNFEKKIATSCTSSAKGYVTDIDTTIHYGCPLPKI